MNEIKHIHLGRQQFTVSLDAYGELHDYLQAIKQQMGANSGDVAEEVEMRMAELLGERGVTTEKVILLGDVKYLQAQLGQPKDFKEDDTDIDSAGTILNEDAPKRLFRDTQNGMVAGVAAGLAAYLNIDVVIIRLIFAALVFAGGSGVFIYVIMWLIVPEAKTTSEQLQMRGKAVTVDSLKSVVDKADIGGTARRTGSTVARMIQIAFKLILIIIGVGMTAFGIALLCGAIGSGIYGFTNGAHVAGVKLFPVNLEQHFILLCGMTVLLVFAVMFIVLGVTLVRRRWPLANWALAVLLGLFIIGASTGVGLSFDAGAKIRQQYLSLEHTKIIPIVAYTQANFVGDNVLTQIEYGPTYEVQVRTLGNLDTSAIRVTQKNGQLTIDSTQYHPGATCNFICPYGNTNTLVVIETPNADNLFTPDFPDKPIPMPMQMYKN